MDFYAVKQFHPTRDILRVEVPSSKSILNRALILASIAPNPVFLRCGSYAEDTRALINCLQSLGVKINACKGGINIDGTSGFEENVTLNVMSAGTAARFLPSLLAVRGGKYRFECSMQMQRRPMSHLALLQREGVEMEYGNEEYHFPFTLTSNGFHAKSICVDTNESTQYASGLLLAACASDAPFTLHLEGDRTNGSYIQMTLALIKAFGYGLKIEGNTITVLPCTNPPREYAVEADVSAACYFYSLALLFPQKVLVPGVHFNTLQGDIAFLSLLKERGVLLEQTEEGIIASGSGKPFCGFDCDMVNFSDQALTLGALASFGSTPSRLYNLAHIRKQECDRVSALEENINLLGGNALSEQDSIYITPSPLHGGRVMTYSDHRVAMSFALIGLLIDGIEIQNPACTQKTFDDFFTILDSITK